MDANQEKELVEDIIGAETRPAIEVKEPEKTSLSVTPYKTQPERIPEAQQLKVLRGICKEAMISGFFKNANESQLLLIAMKGLELGMAPIHAITHINIIQGKPCLSSEGMLALIFEKVPGVKLTYKTWTNDECTIECVRPGQDINTFSYTIKDADQAGLLSKGSWKTHTKSMLKARVISMMARALFPDVLCGVSYTIEELGGDVDEN